MESNSSNAIAWESNRKRAFPWKFQFHFDENHGLSSTLDVVFSHELRSGNSMADALAKQGVDRLSP